MRFSTILKGNAKKHKITLIVLAFLCLIVSACANTAAAVMTASRGYVNAEAERIGYGDMTYWLSSCDDHGALSADVESNSAVGTARIQPVIFSGYTLNGGHSDNEGQLIAYEPNEYDYKFLSEDLKSHEEPPEISDNEIYVSPAMISSFGAKIGDEVTFELSRTNDKAIFTIAGFYEDPFMGSSMIDMKGFLVSKESYAALTEKIGEISDFDVLAKSGAMLHVTAADKSISSEQFGRTLRQNTGIGRYTEFMYSKETISGFMLILQEIFTGFLFGFAAILFAVSLVMIGHTVSFSIEQERADIGILKAIGCTNSFLRRVLLCEYGLAGAAGLIVGMIVSVPLTRLASKANVTSCGLLIPANISWTFTVIFTLLWLVIMTVFIYSFSRKIVSITPISAISGRTESQTNAARNSIDPKSLSLTLGLRQLLSDKKRYISICLISAVLVMFTGIVARMNAWLGAKGEGLMDAFSAADHDIGFQPVTAVDMSEVERIISGYDEIREIYGLAMMSASIDGADCTANVIDNVDKFHIISGRTPGNPNEIVITKYISENVGISVGDDVTVEGQGQSAVYHISGIYQCANEMGANIGMSQQGFERLADTDGYIWCYHYILADGSRNEQILKDLQNRYRVRANVHTNSWSGLDGIVGSMHMLTAFMLAVTALFVLAAVSLEGGKMLKAEEKDLAVYQSIGFTSRKLRLSFAIRISAAALVGACIGTAVCIISADGIISTLMSFFGIGEFVSEYGALTSAASGILIVFIFFTAAFAYSRRIRKVPISILTAEN